MGTACTNGYICCKGCATIRIHRTVSLTTVATIVDGNIIVKLWCVFQAIATCCATGIAYDYLVGNGVRAICVSCNSAKVFNHFNVR